MKTDDKSLLVHIDSGSDKTASVIVDEKEVVEKTKEFLEKIAKEHKKTTVNVYYPLGVVLKATDEKEEQEYAYAVAYEKEKFVIVVPNGTAESAKLYGNWNEALTCAKKILAEKHSPDKKIRIIVDQYIQKTQ